MLRRRSLLVAALVAAGSLSLFAHDDEKFKQDRQPAFQGAGYVPGSGLQPGLGYSSTGVTLLSWLTLGDLDPLATSGSDCWGYVSGSGREYALIGQSNGTTVVEVTSPDNPQVIATIDGPDSLWRDVKVYGTHAYAVSEGGSGIQVIDLSNVDSGMVTLVGNNTSGSGTTASHNVAINEASGYLYRCGGGSSPTEGLRIYSLANPANPTYVSSWNARYVHDAQIVTYTSGPNTGKEIAFCFAENSSGGGNAGVAIVDVTNKNSPTEIHFEPYSNPVFSHQGWLSPDFQYLYIGDELDEQSFGTKTTTRIMDVSNLNNPFQVGTFTNGNDAIDHNLYTLGNLIFEANYRSGLRVFDASTPTAPVEIAYYDTYTTDDDPAFNGLWNVHPYLPSGVILGSDLEKGLFVWWLGSPNLNFAFPGGQPTAFNPAGDLLQVQIGELNLGDLVPGTAALHVDTGGGFTTIPMSDQGGGLFQVAVPATTCGTTVSYYVSAQSTNGITWTEPAGAPATSHSALSGVGRVVLFYDDMEVDRGFTSGAPGDNATTGLWTRGNPVGTAAQPEDDHTADPAANCWFTGQGNLGGSIGDNDVDGGTTTLRTPIFDCSDMDEPVVSYWRWYSNNGGASPGEDTFVVDISGNGGVSWTNLEVVGPTGAETVGGWFLHVARLRDFFPPTAAIQLRFRASDLGSGSIVEAAIDDFEIYDAVCTRPAVTIDGNPEPGGALTLKYLCDPGDTIFALYGLPPRVSIPTPPFGGELCIFPYFTLTIRRNNPTGEYALSSSLPNDPGLSGLEILFQGLVGPVLSGPGADADWTNCAALNIR